jgi:fatty acid desaturase
LQWIASNECKQDKEWIIDLQEIKMKLNMGTLDRIIRLAAAAAFVGLYFGGVVTGLWGTVLLVVAAVFTLTAAVGFCPIYALAKISTRK